MDAIARALPVSRPEGPRTSAHACDRQEGRLLDRWGSAVTGHPSHADTGAMPGMDMGGTGDDMPGATEPSSPEIRAAVSSDSGLHGSVGSTQSKRW